MLAYNKEKLINYNIINKSMLKYPISTLLYLAKINIKDKIQDALKLHNNIDVKLTVTVKDKNEKIIKQHKQRSHSFVSNFLAILTAPLTTGYGQPFTNASQGYFFRITTGTYAIYNPTAEFNTVFDLNSGANNSTYGIVVGTGTTPPTPNDFNLGNQISNGTGSGQLVYGTHTFNPTPVSNNSSNFYTTTSTPTSGLLPVSGNTTSWQISRTFQNQSGASITVSEVGLISEINVYYVLLTHDLLSSPITIPNGGVMAITYTISVST